MTAAPKITVLDLFCGAGGLSLGLARAGLMPIVAVDNNKAALQTYATNLGGHGIEQDLAKEGDLPETTVVVGGPPCQGFSSAGLRQSNDHRNSLVNCFARTVAKLQPRIFVFENVEGFLTAERGDRVIELLEPLINAGYRIHLRKINAANYGVPQHRKRLYHFLMRIPRRHRGDSACWSQERHSKIENRKWYNILTTFRGSVEESERS